MRQAFALTGVLALSGCAHIDTPALDEQREVRLVTYAGLRDVDAACRAAGYRTLPFPLTVIEGCTVYTKKSCTIFARTPGSGIDTNAFHILGHEAFHCFDGDWHEDRQEVHLYEARADDDRSSEPFVLRP
jgi:hypothetical protein